MRSLICIAVLLFSFQSFAQEVSEIVFQENKRSKTAFLQNLVELRPGMTLDSTQLERDVNFMIRLAGVSHAYYQVYPKADGTVKVVYGVQDNFTLIPQLNVYTTNDDEFAYRVGLYEYNFLGRNITVGGFYQDDIFSSFGLNFRAPNLFSRKFGLALNYGDITTLEPVFLDSGDADYRYNNTSIEALALYQFNFFHSAQLGLNFFNEDYDYVSGATQTGIPLDFDVDKVLFKGIYEYRNVDFYFQYLEGFRSMLNLQYVVSSEPVLPDFFIGWNDFIYYKRVGELGNWASRLRVGLASNDESPFAPFAVDNNLNIRGVGNIIDRGTGVIVLNTEYRHTLIDKDWFVLQGNVFVDSGSWRNPGGDLSDFGDSQNLRIYPGVGLRFIHKRIFNAIFRIDYGYGITDKATRGFVFGIGQYF